jgi:hypothetical protein
MAVQAQAPSPAQAIAFFQMQINNLQNAMLKKYMTAPSLEVFTAIKACVDEACECVGDIEPMIEMIPCGGGGEECQAYEHCEDGQCWFGPPENLSAGERA